MNRRGFLLGAGGILASFAAPAIVRADSLMRIVPRDVSILPLPPIDVDVFVDGMARYMDRLAYSILVRDQSGRHRIEQGSVVVPAEGFNSGDIVHIAELWHGESIETFQVVEAPEIAWKKPPSLLVTTLADERSLRIKLPRVTSRSRRPPEEELP